MANSVDPDQTATYVGQTLPSCLHKEADRRRGGKTISKSGQEWTLPAQLGQLKTGQDVKGLL